MSIILPPQPPRLDALGALLVYLDDIAPSVVYALHFDRGAWRFAAVDPDSMPNLTRDAAAQPVEVDVYADLRRLPAGSSTVVTSLPEDQEV